MTPILTAECDGQSLRLGVNLAEPSSFMYRHVVETRFCGSIPATIWINGIGDVVVDWSVLPRDGFWRADDGQVDGVVGGDVLQMAAFAIDFRNAEVRFDFSGRALNDTAGRLTVSKGCFTVPAVINGQGPFACKINVNSSAHLVSPSTVRILRAESAMFESSLHGSDFPASLVLEKVQVDGIVRYSQPAFVFELSPPDGRLCLDVDALLGAPLFDGSKLRIDLRRGLFALDDERA